jgi:hypothetical protein
MARSDPEKLAQALRVNLRRRKSATAGPQAPVETEKAPESVPEKPPPPQG